VVTSGEGVYDGFISRHLNRRLSRPIARALKRTPVTPNQVSVVSLGVAALALVAFVYGYNIVGGVLTQVSSIVDGVDGDLARVKGMASPFGGFLDAVLDRYADVLIVMGLAMWTAIAQNATLAWVLGFWAVTGSLIISYTRARVPDAARTVFDRGVTSLASRDVRLLVIAVGAVAGQGLVTLALIAGSTHGVVFLRLVRARRVLANRDGDE
jgi:phosphatidylglycerophosphate synthase